MTADEIPAPLSTDVADFLERIGGNSPFRKGRPTRPVTAATLRQRGPSEVSNRAEMDLARSSTITSFACSPGTTSPPTQ